MTREAMIRTVRALAVAGIVFAVAGCSDLGVYDLSHEHVAAAEFTVRDVSVTAGHESVSLSWTDPAGTRLERVEIVVEPGGRVVEVGRGVGRVTIDGLANDTAYSLALYAVDTAGTSGLGVTVTGTPRLHALAIGSASVSGGDEEISVSWSDPDAAGLTGFELTVEPGGFVETVAPGVESVVVGNLENDVEYTVTITALGEGDDRGPTRTLTATPRLPTFPDDSWAVTSAVSRRRILIDNRGVAESFTGFPLMVRLDASRIDYGATDGTDLRFFDAGVSTELPYEIERWDESGESIVWVRVPEISANARDSIWIYWGGGAATSFHDSAAVWQEYELVMHLNGTLTDSSPNGRDGSAVGSVRFEAGAVAEGVRVGDTSGTSFVDIPSWENDFDRTTLGAYTVEVWMRGDAAPELGSPNGPLMAQHHFNIGWDHNNAGYVGTYHFRHQTASWTPIPASPLEGGRWYYAAAVFDGSAGTATSLRDGAVDSVRDGLTGTTSDRVTYLRLGADGGAPSVFNGLVDEVRVAHVARTSSWIAAQHRSMQDAMIELGAVETP